jgi:hypothetical protein
VSQRFFFRPGFGFWPWFSPYWGWGGGWGGGWGNSFPVFSQPFYNLCDNGGYGGYSGYNGYGGYSGFNGYSDYLNGSADYPVPSQSGGVPIQQLRPIPASGTLPNGSVPAFAPNADTPVRPVIPQSNDLQVSLKTPQPAKSYTYKAYGEK